MQARLLWPNILLDETTLRSHLTFLGWVEELPPFFTDVYFNCACGLGNNAACHLFDRDK